MVARRGKSQGTPLLNETLTTVTLVSMCSSISNASACMWTRGQTFTYLYILIELAWLLLPYQEALLYRYSLNSSYKNEKLAC